MGEHITVQDSAKIFELRAQGYSQSEIGCYAGRDRGTIKNHLKRGFPETKITIAKAMKIALKKRPKSMTELIARITIIRDRSVTAHVVRSVLNGRSNRSDFKRLSDGRISLRT